MSVKSVKVWAARDEDGQCFLTRNKPVKECNYYLDPAKKNACNSFEIDLDDLGDEPEMFKLVRVYEK